MSILKGACLCEAVRYQVRGEPEGIFTCYCMHCAKNAGAQGQISAKYDSANVDVVQGEDKLTTYVLNDTASGVEKHKVFCCTCGCTLWTVPMKYGGQKLIVRTSLIENGLTLLKPHTELFKDAKVDY